ncbi:MAG: uroporphyrinogen decarboxylase family protein [Verrucomicrobiota bacterium]
MTPRERLHAALNHQEGDRVPVDFGSTAVTGMHVSAVTRLRRAVLKDDAYRVKVIEPYQMLGEIDTPLREALGIDAVGLMPRKTFFGFENEDWKPFRMFDGTEVLVPGNFNVTANASGDYLIYPEGDTAAPASGHMPKDAFFFDTIVRQPPVDEDKLNPADNLEEFAVLDADTLQWYDRRIRELEETSGGVVLTMPGTGFGDIALVPVPWLKHPKGIRDIEEWYISTAVRKDYVHAIFEKQCEIGLKNLETLIARLGNRVQAVFLTGADFGTQRGTFISKEAYRELFKPYHTRINKLVHQKSSWKTFIHSCGAVYDLLPDFIDAGFDILNPVQCSAARMDARTLKNEFGQHLVFWGGGANTQQTLPFGTPDEVYREVRERIEIFGAGGGFVFDTVHNVQGPTPVANLRAMFKALKDAGRT